MNILDKLKFSLAKSQLKNQRKKYAKLPILGERFTVPRAGLDGVDTILHRPHGDHAGPLPVLFNLHGGAWVALDAVMLESLCALLADAIPALVVNVNYKKVDVHPFPYQQIELCDTVQYFAEHAQEFGVDQARFAVMGESAGAHISAGAALRLKELGFSLACQVLVYPFVDFTLSSHKNDAVDKRELGWLELLKTAFFGQVDLTQRWLSPLIARDEELAGIAPAVVIVCGKDVLKPQGVAYARRLNEVGVPAKLKEYPEAEHGFLEVNRPETVKDPRKTPEQLALTKDCEQYLIGELKACFYG